VQIINKRKNGETLEKSPTNGGHFKMLVSLEPVGLKP
jgi:hypothetical protein